VSKLAVPRLLVAHSQLDVLAFGAGHAFYSKLIAKVLGERAIPDQETRLEHRRFRQHVAVGLGQRLFYRPRRVSDLETDVPKEVQNLLRHFFDIWGDFARAVAMQ